MTLRPLVLACVCAFVGSLSSAFAQTPPAASNHTSQPAVRPYDGIQAGLDAFRLGEERRQINVAQQLAHADQLKYWAGIPNVRGQAIFYGYPAPPMSLDYAYAYGPALVRYRYAPLTVFEPWPYVPGDIYCYSYYLPVRQPIGVWQGQTGPNRWESHPIYDPPLQGVQPLPPVEPPAAAAPATPPASPVPNPPTPRRPQREF